MGTDKALLPFGGFSTLTEYQLRKFETHFEHVYISCKHKSKFNFDAHFIEDDISYHDSSPLIALASVFAALKCQEIFVISVDTPFFAWEHFAQLYAYHDKGYAAVIPRSKSGIQPLCGYYRNAVNPFVLKSIQKERYRLSRLLEQVPTMIVDFEDEGIFTNLNFQEEYQEALQKGSIG